MADKVVIQLIEADVDVGFALVDEARAFRTSGWSESSSCALHEAKNILADI